MPTIYNFGLVMSDMLCHVHHMHRDKKKKKKKLSSIFMLISSSVLSLII